MSSSTNSRGYFSIYRLNLFSFSIIFFLHFCPGEVSLNIRVLCPSAWEGLLVGRGRSPKARTLLPSSAPWLWLHQVGSRSCCGHCWSGVTPHWILEQDLPQELSWEDPLAPRALLRDALGAPSSKLGWDHSLSDSWCCQDPLAAECVEMGVR